MMTRRIVSKVPALISERGWDRTTWQGYCRLKGMSFFTADRLYDGETNFRERIWLAVAEILEANSISDLYDIVSE